MFDVFTAHRDLTPYTARPNNIALDEVAPVVAAARGELGLGRQATAARSIAFSRAAVSSGFGT